MMQISVYPQGEGGHECERAAHRYAVSSYVCFTPLLSRFVVRTTRRQIPASMGVNLYGY
jgi:hypothetical protein